MGKDEVLVARETFSCVVDGREVLVWKGETRVRAGDPLVKGREGLFEPAESHGVADAPAVGRRRKRAAPR